jgi:uncharacterized RDD family membrane protein YckC
VPRVERSVDVRTGEAVAIRYELAGLGSRFLALVVDMLAQALLLIVLAIAAGFTLPLFRNPTFSAWLLALLIAVLFLIFFGWFIIFEIWWSGRTPGKRALGLRVVRDGGFPIDAGAAVIRNVVRIVEFSIGFYAASAVCALLSRENKRLGDFAAGTIVVRDRAETAPDLDAYLARPVRSDTGLSDGDRHRSIRSRAFAWPRRSPVACGRRCAPTTGTWPTRRCSSSSSTASVFAQSARTLAFGLRPIRLA